MLDKKYWEGIKAQIEQQKENAEGAIEQDKALIELCNKKISEFVDDKKEQKDDMPDAIKDIVKEVGK